MFSINGFYCIVNHLNIEKGYQKVVLLIINLFSILWDKGQWKKCFKLMQQIFSFVTWYNRGLLTLKVI